MAHGPVSKVFPREGVIELEEAGGTIASSARRAGVTLYVQSPGRFVAKCDKCGRSWHPDVRPSSGGQFTRGWRKCPKGCNAEHLSNT